MPREPPVEHLRRDARHLRDIRDKARAVGHDAVAELQKDGVHVHKAIQDWIDTGKWETRHEGAQWIKYWLMQQDIRPVSNMAGAECFVTDYKKYASAVDIVQVRPDRTLHIMDIKRSFKRKYVTMQLNIYKYLIEEYTDWRVSKMSCICFGDKCVFPVLPSISKEEIEKLLYGKTKKEMPGEPCPVMYVGKPKGGK